MNFRQLRMKSLTNSPRRGKRKLLVLIINISRYCFLLLIGFSGLETIERAIEAPATVTTTNSTSAFAVDEIQVQNDLSAINRIIKNSSKTSPSSPPPQQQSQQNAEVSV